MDFESFPNTIVQGVICALDVEDRINAALVNKRLRAEIMHRDSMRDFRVSVFSAEQVNQARNLLTYATNVEVCIGTRVLPAQEDQLLDALRSTLRHCKMIECLDISKCSISLSGNEDTGESNDEIAIENAKQITQLRASWHYSQSRHFARLLSACSSSLELLVLTEPLCRLRLNESSRNRLDELRFDSSVSDSAVLMDYKFFRFLAEATQLGIQIDQFVCVGSQCSNQFSLQPNLLNMTARTFEGQTLTALSLPRTAIQGYDEEFYHLLGRQAASLRQLRLDITSAAEVQRIAECLCVSKLRSVEIAQRNAEIGREMSALFLPSESASAAQDSRLLVSSFSGLRWPLLRVLVPLLRNLRSLTLSQVDLTNANFRQIARDCRKLQRVRLVQCALDSFHFDPTEDLAQQQRTCFPELKSFEVYDCPTVRETAFEHFKVRTLRKFSMHFCAQPDTSCQLWRFLPDNCPLLSSLSLKHRNDCIVSDEEMALIFSAIARFRCLRVLCCFRYRTVHRKNSSFCIATNCFGVNAPRTQEHSHGEDLLEELKRNFRFLRVELCEAPLYLGR